MNKVYNNTKLLQKVVDLGLMFKSTTNGVDDNRAIQNGFRVNTLTYTEGLKYGIHASVSIRGNSNTFRGHKTETIGTVVLEKEGLFEPFQIKRAEVSDGIGHSVDVTKIIHL